MAAAFCARCGNRLVINGAGVAACPRCEASSFASAPGVSGGPASYPAPNQMVGGGPGALPPPPLPPGYQAAPRAAGGGSVNADEIRKRALQAVDYGKRASLNWLTQARKAMAKDVRDIPVSGAEAEQLATRGITDLAVQRHFVWRRSLLAFIVVPTIFTAVFGSINNFSGGLENLSAFGVIMMLLYTASLWAIPACSLLAALKWDRPAASRRILLIGFLAAFLMIIVLGLLPFGWWLKFDAPDDPEARKLVAQSIALIGGLVMMMQMLPPVLSLLPGAIRACVRIKVLFPESIVSGWLLITVAPLYALFLLTFLLR